MISKKLDHFSLGTDYEERIYCSYCHQSPTKLLKESVLPPGNYCIVDNYLRRTGDYQDNVPKDKL